MKLPGRVWQVPMLNLATGIDAHHGELEAAIARVVRSAAFIDGPDVGAFEEEMARYLGVSACVGLNSGTDALVIGLRALGIEPGDEVIVPAFTFVATAEAVRTVGAAPVFVDVDPRTHNLDVSGLDPAVTSRTRAIIPVHLFGQAAPMGPILEWAGAHGVAVLEDAAQALGGAYQGRKLGSLGAAAALSFFPSKTLGAFGDAGMLATDRPELAELARQLRQHGARDKYAGERIGYNSRLDSIQAAVLRVKLPHLDEDIVRRRAIAGRYDALLAGVPGLELPFRIDDGEHAFQQYTISVEPELRDVIVGQLEAEGIQSAVYYRAPLHLLPAYRGRELTLPNAEAAAKRVISLPIWPEMTLAEQSCVASALRRGAARG